MLLAACCLTLTGCARKETGSELLTETKDAVVPVDGKVDPVVEETPEGTAFHLYYGDENAENIAFCIFDTIWNGYMVLEKNFPNFVKCVFVG